MIGGKLIRCQNALKWSTYTLSFTYTERTYKKCTFYLTAYTCFPPFAQAQWPTLWAKVHE